MKKRYSRKIELIVIDIAIFLFCYYVVAVSITNNFNIFSSEHPFYFIKGIAFMLITLFIRTIFKVYKSLWRYANYFTYIKIVSVDFLSAVIFILLGLILSFFKMSLLGILAIIALNMLGCLGSRFTYQIIYYYTNKMADERDNTDKAKLNKINVAIVGAGNIGASLVTLLQRNPKSHYNPYCFIDSDTTKVGSIVCGLEVFYDDEQILEHIKNMPIQEIIIAIADLDTDSKTKLFNKYKQTNCKVKIYDYPIVDGETSIKGRIREFNIEDLLFRDTLKFVNKETQLYYKDKVVLVTGGGGSIGSEICRQVAKQKPKKLIIIDIYENNAYEIQQELIRKYGDELNLEVYIASVRDEKRLDELFKNTMPNIVIHAAAHKHVPLMEDSASEAIKNNVLGTYYTANLAEKYKVEKFLLISSDKAVNPTNVMGASKRLCEMVIQCRKDSKTTKFTAVRFGNVLGSNGSVIPLFKKQINSGGPITITDKRIIRYFMTIPEATQLVLEAGAMAKNGELFVLDMGKPVKIIDLAENMIRLSGLTPYEDIDIQEIGLRPGEKLYEELLMANEELSKTENKMIFIEKDKPYTRQEIEDKITILVTAVESGDNEKVKEAIKLTVPTYISTSLANSKIKEIVEKEMAGTIIEDKNIS